MSGGGEGRCWSFNFTGTFNIVQRKGTSFDLNPRNKANINEAFSLKLQFFPNKISLPFKRKNRILPLVCDLKQIKRLWTAGNLTYTNDVSIPVVFIEISVSLYAKLRYFLLALIVELHLVSKPHLEALFRLFSRKKIWTVTAQVAQALWLPSTWHCVIMTLL